jgi:hypothetical protein
METQSLSATAGQLLEGLPKQRLRLVRAPPLPRRGAMLDRSFSSLP